MAIEPEQLARLRARVLWYALRTAVLEGRGVASFRRGDLERMLELTPGESVEAAVQALPADAVEVVLEDGRVLLRQPSTGDAVEDILLHWKAATGRGPRTVLDAKRRSVAKRALKLGFDAEQCKQAITAMSASKWHQGQNGNGQRYDDVAHALGSAERIERWLSTPRDSDPTEPMEAARRKAQERKAGSQRTSSGRRRRR